MITAVVLVALAALAAAAWTYRTTLLGLIPTPPVVITEQYFGKTVDVLVGQTLQVNLPSNRFSGSRWDQTIPVSFLQPVGQITFTEDRAAKHPGDGVQTMSFLVTDKGSGPLFLSYTPNNDQNSLTPSKSFRVVIIAR